jgi:flagellin
MELGASPRKPTKNVKSCPFAPFTTLAIHFWQGKMSVINTNNAALKSQLASKIADSKLTKSAQRLSSGRRINSSADDAAGTAVGLKLHAQLQGQKAAIKTASDAISLLKLQETGTSQFISIIERIREISVQMASGSYSNSDRSLAQLEVDALKSQIELVASGTMFNNKQILNASSATNYEIQAGANKDESFTIAVIQGATLSTNVTSDADVTTQSNAHNTMDKMLTHFQTAQEYRATIGASINRLSTTINNLSESAVNTEVAFGRVVDADYARETINLAKQNVLANASQAMLANANQSKRLVIMLVDE